MELSLPKTRNGWIALGVSAAIIAAFLYFFTPVFRGHAVEVSLENASGVPIFAHIDNTGRHGDGTTVDTLTTTNNSRTPPGLRIGSQTTKSFGMAVGLFDSPTLHVWSITEGGAADANRVNDCAFDTIVYKKLEIPSIHVRLKWTGVGCERKE
jgi:hypothetical protein